MRKATGVSVFAALTLLTLGGRWLAADDNQPVHRVFADRNEPQDVRFAPPRLLRDAYHPWTPPETLPMWEAEKERIRKQLLVSNGLWPLPEKTPLNPVIHGLVERDDYTVERVFFASRPGLYVTGSLYRPKGDRTTKRPAVLCPHGHWPNGRFYDAGEAAAKQQIEIGAESDPAAARFPVQARMVQLARMGCVVFFYDMIGNADNGPLDHTAGFSDAQSELWSQNLMGLQTWNSIRACDFVESLPDVDPQRIAVTGASGGGTQTFMLCAIDPRPVAAFPAVMVSTGMQGGCVCENASWLRLGINNVAIAACFAPKPMAMSGADDWTIDIETKGLPELKHIYGLYGKPELVHAKCFPQFKHNYNQVARLMMYEWFNQHLNLGLPSPITERPFEPLTREESTVFTAEHPRPQDALPPAALRERMTEETAARTAQWAESSDPGKTIEVLGPVLMTVLGTHVGVGTFHETSRSEQDGYTLVKGWADRNGDGIRVPCLQLLPKGDARSVVIWVDGAGKQALFDSQGQPILAVRRLLDSGTAIVTADVLMTGEAQPCEDAVDRKVNEAFPGYTWGYNRPLLAERLRDILLLTCITPRPVRPIAANEFVQPDALIGTNGAGPWCLLVHHMARRTIADLNGMTFAGITSVQDQNLLPGASKFGGLGGMMSFAIRPGQPPLELFGCTAAVREELQPLLKRQSETRTNAESLTADRVAELLLP